ncbi:lysoplasmalogenase [Thalassotalea euphylliae]|uniref:Lysoplasmalogenase n=1 Tax=Thalassotalea euphylliae TaxID=1655234 RepID=A0A3E0TNQ9_9GAMM|nr:lysoplasmalogenase [Thalassotalea euphylliae]REL25635.1 lysoplasmalogenase [Thalassotalea euphylliae]
MQQVAESIQTKKRAQIKHGRQILLSVLFFIFATSYLCSLVIAPYTGQFLLKVSPIVCLLIMVLTARLEAPAQKPYRPSSTKRLLLVAIIASGTGDVLLALPLQQSFVMGLAAFLVAQCLYAVIFLQNRTNKPARAAKLVAAGIIVFAAVMAFYLLPATGELLLPVIVYLTAITVMAVAAWHSHYGLKAKLGVSSFVVSDAVLATTTFHTSQPWGTAAVMVTYYAAQYLIINGVVSDICGRATTTAHREHMTQEPAPEPIDPVNSSAKCK